MNTFKLEIITPGRAHPVRDVSFLNVPAENGPLTVLAGHEPLICHLKEGTVRIKDPAGVEEAWQVRPGMLTVTKSIVSILTQDATTGTETR